MTVIDLRVEEATQRAVRLAIDLATHRINSPVEVTLTPNIIYRDSSPAPTLAEQAVLSSNKLFK